MKSHAVVAALGALLMGASAQTTVPPEVQHSVLLVLATAIPSESVSYAMASQSAFAAEMASSLAAGNPPAWYQALPSDVKSLLPQIYPAQAVATTTATYSAANSSITPGPSSHNSTSAANSHTSSASRTASASVPAFTGAAARIPTAVIGASIGTILGLLSIYAL